MVHVTLIYLFSVEVTLPTQLGAGYRFALSICERTVRDIEITLMDSYQESMHRLSKISPQLDLLPTFWGRRHEEISKDCIFHFPMVKHFWEVSRINNFEQQCCSRTVHMFRSQMGKMF